MDNNNRNSDDFDFPGTNTSGKEGRLISKEMLDKLKDTSNAAGQMTVRPGSSDAPAVKQVQELSFGDVDDAGKTIAVNTIKSEVGQARPAPDAFGKPAHRPGRAPAQKDVADDHGFIDIAAKKKRKRKKIIIGIVSAILGLIVGCLGFVIYFLNKIDTIDENEAPVTIVDESGNTVRIADITQPTQHEIIEEEHIHNFLLIGIDTRSAGRESWGNSDVNMVMSVDSEAGTIKMISIARDSYAYVPGYSNPMKINAAMAYGGPELLEATIEGCLRLDIDGYAFVNFYNLANVIDSVGGVVVNLTSSEVYADHGLNMCLDELGYSCFVNQTGDVLLNGPQAVAYGRVRYVGNGDYERSERQVEVLRSLFDRFMDLSAIDKLGAVDDILEMVSTNIPKTEIVGYVVDFLPALDDPSIQYMQLPITGDGQTCFNSGMYGGEWSIRANWNAQIPFVQEFFYGEQVDFDPVQDIPSSPSLDSCPTPDTLPIETLLR
ncbi:MAG: LCP family protein [Saccharofermentans sp.]|nr:LCP family protein [Saccharofermentans sp.]